MRLVPAILGMSIIHFALSKSIVKRVDLKKWKWISHGRADCVWMIYFYAETDRVAKTLGSKTIDKEFADAATILEGIVQAGSYKVEKDFPEFLRIPSVLVYLTGSKHPLVVEMKLNKAQVQRPAYKLVKSVKKAITWRRVMTDLECEEPPKDYVPPVVPWDELTRALKGYLEDTHYLVYLTADQMLRRREVYCMKRIVDRGKKWWPDLFANVKHGWLDVTENMYQLEGYDVTLKKTPEVALLVALTNEDHPGHFEQYDGELQPCKVVEWAAWEILAHADITAKTTQLGVTKDAMNVGKLLKMENQTFLITTH